MGGFAGSRMMMVVAAHETGFTRCLADRIDAIAACVIVEIRPPDTRRALRRACETVPVTGLVDRRNGSGPVVSLPGRELLLPRRRGSADWPKPSGDPDEARLLSSRNRSRRVPGTVRWPTSSWGGYSCASHGRAIRRLAPRPAGSSSRAPVISCSQSGTSSCTSASIPPVPPCPHGVDPRSRHVPALNGSPGTSGSASHRGDGCARRPVQGSGGSGGRRAS